jgi:hypothetical protein
MVVAIEKEIPVRKADLLNPFAMKQQPAIWRIRNLDHSLFSRRRDGREQESSERIKEVKVQSGVRA